MTRVLAFLMALAMPAVSHADARSVRRALRDATVDLARGCSGAVAESSQLVVTAYHCVDGAGDRMQLRLSTGETRTGWIVAVDRAADQAVLFLEQPARVTPLAIAHRRQVPGTVLYFAGRPTEPRFQEARLERLGRCPSLPDLPNALFTTIHGRPGDSGAPLVDGAARIVGLVHGGARCEIATPADRLLRLIDEILQRPATVSRVGAEGGRGGGSASGERHAAAGGAGAAYAWIATVSAC